MYPKITVPWVFSFIMAIVGILAVVSGVYAYKRKNWRLVIAGSICTVVVGLIDTVLNRLILKGLVDYAFSLLIALIPMFLIITSLVLLAMSKKEFMDSVKPDLASPD